LGFERAEEGGAGADHLGVSGRGGDVGVVLGLGGDDTLKLGVGVAKAGGDAFEVG
jgi:hypothetical protein